MSTIAGSMSGIELSKKRFTLWTDGCLKGIFNSLVKYNDMYYLTCSTDETFFNVFW